MDKLYVVVRSDLPLGDQLAQCGHAVASFALASSHAHTLFAAWHAGANNLVVLAVRSEVELERLLARVAETDGHCIAEVHEPDLDDALTAIAFAGTRAAARCCASLPLAPAVPRAA